MRAHRLAELREALGLTQVALAERLQVSQSRVSRIERGAIDHTQLETLRAYLEALGGELEVSARFGDERIPISGRARRGRFDTVAPLHGRLVVNTRLDFVP